MSDHMKEKKEDKDDNIATRAAKKNSGLLGGAARAFGSRRNRIDEILANAVTPDRIQPVKGK